MLAIIFLLAVVAFLAAYRVYGFWISRKLDLNDGHAVPSELQFDGVDYVPTKTPVLFGHHFSSIAGAGPIVGPILAGLFFGWVPAVLWIVLGSIFVGGVHDFGSLVASIRHKARSVAELARDYMTPLAFKLFLAFIWLALIYVIVVFADLTAVSFVDEVTPEGRVLAKGSGVALASGLFIVLALALGFVNQKTKVPLGVSTAVFVALLLVAVGVSSQVRANNEFVPALFANPKHFWLILLLLYCLVASVTPVWILLHPRDYLSSFMLYVAVLGGALGIVIGSVTGGLQATWPAFVSPSNPVFREVPHLGPLFPILFITIACGACSGFHSIVASGTTSKQLRCETDARRIGYAGMLVEGVVAVIALGTVMMMGFSASALRGNPVTIYATGMGRFFAVFGVPLEFGMMLGLLALSTFLLTTLDTCTRLGRYVLQEFFGWDNTVAWSRWIATVMTLALPALLAFLTYSTPDGQVIPVWKAIWPVFGATNQLLAGLALLAVTVWLKRTGRVWLFAGAPMAFMVVMTMTALGMLILSPSTAPPVRTIAVLLFSLGLLLVYEAVRALGRPAVEPEPIVWRAVPVPGMVGD